MKVRVSATIEEKTEKILRVLLKKRKYRNKSHVIEDAIELLAREDEGDKNKK